MALSFWGYPRPGGEAGTRNVVAVIASVICSTVAVQEIARNVRGAVPVVHRFGCSQVGDDLSQTRRTLAGVAGNPNVGAVVIVGLGCETNQAAELAAHIPSPKPVEIIGIQELGGSDVAARTGIEIANAFVRRREEEARTLCGAEALTVGVLGVDGGERAYATAYPAVGWAVDRLVDAGARVIVGLTSALAPAADALAERAGGGAARERLLGLSPGLSRRVWADAAQTTVLVRPWTDEERRRAVRELALTGSRAVQEVVAYAERPQARGLVLMTLPRDPVEALTGLVAGGASVILVASSRGLFSGAVAVPTLVAAPPPVRPSALDQFVDLRVETDDAAVEGEKICDRLLEIASGAACVAEQEGTSELAISQLWTPF